MHEKPFTQPHHPQRWSGSRLPWILGWLVCAVWAAVFPFASALVPQRAWGAMAAVGYLLAAGAAAWLPRRRAATVSTAVALLGAVVVPLIVMSVEYWAQSEVHVVQNSAVQLLHTGSPYLPKPGQTYEYDPYFPAMTLFGLPRAVLGSHGWLPTLLGDARIWFLAAFLGCLAACHRLLRPGTDAGSGSGSGSRTGFGSGSGWVALAAVTASPLVAVVAVTGGVDLPLIGCCCLGLALAGRGHATRAGLVLALACAVKWTAWPALPVAALLLHQLYGRRAALRCAAVGTSVAAALIVPSVLITPGAVLEQVVRFPLGMSRIKTPAGSPLPGHLLAGLGPMGRAASFALLALGCLAVAAWLLRRPPRSTVQAADRLALGVAVAFLLAPAGRFGYLQLPLLLVLWPRLAAGTWPDRPNWPALRLARAAPMRKLDLRVPLRAAAAAIALRRRSTG
ncbi:MULTISPECIES: glycosyltransferase 87 family protein [Streptacidiphilus]|uniref:Glycosyltransferase 87 family protein n=1 Tax=Streptacidiphilus cavernicola TaxID=3342716 RepID=A0ABV6ULR2_9ACTN|nr:glycosyltransferase 87 family protein [Streptacidiphilus jeojiense]